MQRCRGRGGPGTGAWGVQVVGSGRGRARQGVDHIGLENHGKNCTVSGMNGREGDGMGTV